MRAFLYFLSLLLLLVSGCGLAADAITSKAQGKAPVQSARESANEALRDRFLDAIGIDASFFQNAQPPDISETITTELPQEFTTVPGQLYFHQQKDFKLPDFLRYMRQTYGVQLAVTRSQLDDLTGNRISTFRQLHGQAEVYGAYYKAIANSDDEITQAFGKVYDGIEVADQPDLYQEQALAPLKTAHKAVTKWIILQQDQPIPTKVSANTAVVHPGKLYVLPQDLHPKNRHELTVGHQIDGIPTGDKSLVFLGAIEPGVCQRLAIKQRQCATTKEIVTTTVRTAHYGFQDLTTTKICHGQLPDTLETKLQLRFGDHGVTLPFHLYSLDRLIGSPDGQASLYVDFKTTDTLFPALNNYPVSLDNSWSDSDYTTHGYTDAAWAIQQTNTYFTERHRRTDFQTADDTLSILLEAPYSAFDPSTSTIELKKGPNPDAEVHSIAHEYTHFLVDRTAELIYYGESGALNEGISDIMAMAVDDHLNLAGPAWEFDHYHAINGLRNFANPHVKRHPKSYKMEYWHPVADSSDYGGVHTNSSVINHGFYLLGEGFDGTNERDIPVRVEKLGIPTAADIVFRTLSLYLGPSSNYHHARAQTIQAAIDLYGACSKEVKAVGNAWFAVGVGDPYEVCEDIWLSFFTTPNNGATTRIYLNKDREVSIVENNYKLTKVINYPTQAKSSRWVVSNKTDGSVIKTSLPMPYVTIQPTSEEDAFRSLGIALGKRSPTDSLPYSAKDFDDDYLQSSGHYYTEDSLYVLKYRHPTMANTFFWSAPQIDSPILASNWAVRFGVLDPEMSAADNIFRGFLLKMEGPEVNFWLEPPFYTAKENRRLFTDAAVFSHK